MHFYLAWFRNKIVLSCLIIAAIIGGIFVWHHLTHGETTAQKKLSTSTCPSTPNFTAVVPTSTTIDELGGWKPLCPPNSAPAYVYTDTVSGVSLSVTEQPLPANFRDNPNDQIATLARQLSYNDEIHAGQTDAYVGTSTKGPQSAILTKDGLLINIKAASKISDDAWTTYVSSLH